MTTNTSNILNKIFLSVWVLFIKISADVADYVFAKDVIELLPLLFCRFLMNPFPPRLFRDGLVGVVTYIHIDSCRCCLFE